jgi:hypothetical protein
MLIQNPVKNVGLSMQGINLDTHSGGGLKVSRVKIAGC